MLRAAGRDDLELMRAWRNHPDVRAASFTTHEIAPEEHLEWWRSIEADPARTVLVYERFDVPSGIVTFHSQPPDMAEWGFYLDVVGLDERGETLPAWLEVEREAIAYAFDVLGVSSLVGDVIGTNEAVMRLHRRHGFREVGRRVATVDGRDVDVVHIALDRGDRRVARKSQ